MKLLCLVIIIWIVLFNQYSALATSYITPLDWTENTYSSACSTMGITQIAEIQSSIVPLTNEYVYLKKSYIYYKYTNNDGFTANSQKLFKYYIQLGDQTYLQISLISGNDGLKISQTFLIQNSYEFIDADGPYCLLKQTDDDGNALLTLYSFDITQGATTLLQLNSVSLDTYPNEIFKSVSVKYDNYYLNDNQLKDITGTILSINKMTSQAIVRKILNTGFESTQLYKFALTDVNSDVYINLLLGLQILGSNFYAYLSPQYGTASPPYVYANDQTMIQTSAGLFSNHIVIPFMSSMMIATFDDNGQNGNIFFLLDDPDAYLLFLLNIKTTLAAPMASLQYLSDYSTYVIELNLDPVVSTFYIVWADYYSMRTNTFQSSLGDNKNSQIIEDFSNKPKMSSFILAQLDANHVYHSKLFFWIYQTSKIVKYILQTIKSDAPTFCTINKEFSIELVQNLLLNSIGQNFEATTQLKCACQTAKITNMICFYSTDSCTFTVQTVLEYCNPIQND